MQMQYSTPFSAATLHMGMGVESKLDLTNTPQKVLRVTGKPPLLIAYNLYIRNALYMISSLIISIFELYIIKQKIFVHCN